MSVGFVAVGPAKRL